MICCSLEMLPLMLSTSFLYCTTRRPSRPEILLPVDVANIAWAFAAAEVDAPRLYDEIAESVVTRLDHFNSQDLANLCQAYSSVRRSAPKLFDFIAETAVTRGLAAFNAQDLANTAWAYATLEVLDDPLLEAISAAALPRITQFALQELAKHIAERNQSIKELIFSQVCQQRRSRRKLHPARASNILPNGHDTVVLQPLA